MFQHFLNQTLAQMRGVLYEEHVSTQLLEKELIKLTNLAESIAGLKEPLSDMLVPTFRLGVTGLSRAGKTVFISAFLHNIINGGRLGGFNVVKTGRFIGANVEYQPIDDEIARFDYESHIQNIVNDRIWPESTFQIAELRLTIKYEPASLVGRMLGNRRVNIDFVDYPGEWLLDLPLMDKDYSTWCKEVLDQSNRPSRKKIAGKWHDLMKSVEPETEFDMETAMKLTEAFTEYLILCKKDLNLISTSPPGRFLMPGPNDMTGSNAMTFAPLDVKQPMTFKPGSIGERFSRNFNAYKESKVVPFFKNHFSKLDRQVVLVDAFPAINSGPEAMGDLQHVLGEILSCFRPGQNSWLARFMPSIRRIDKVLIAATKADHIYQADHKNLTGIMKHLVENSAQKAESKGAKVGILPLASVRSTREKKNADGKPLIEGIPKKGAVFMDETFNGTDKFAIFPGKLPDSIESLFDENSQRHPLQFAPFRPPELNSSSEAESPELPHINLDKAIEYLIGDKLS